MPKDAGTPRVVVFHPFPLVDQGNKRNISQTAEAEIKTITDRRHVYVSAQLCGPGAPGINSSTFLVDRQEIFCGAAMWVHGLVVKTCVLEQLVPGFNLIVIQGHQEEFSLAFFTPVAYLRP